MNGEFEEAIERFVDKVGIVCKNLGPITMPLVSGSILMFAIYDGGSNALMAIGIPMAAAVSISIFFGLVMVVALEMMSITTMLGDDEAKEIGIVGTIIAKARNNKQGMFVTTVAVIVGFEFIPSLVSAMSGKMEWDIAIFRMTLVIFPFFSRIAASAFSVNRIIKDRGATVRYEKAIKRAEEAAKLSAATTAAAKIAEEELLEDARRKEEERDAKHLIKIAKMTGAAPVQRPVQKPDQDMITPDQDKITDHELALLMIDRYKEDPSVSDTKLGDQHGVSRGRVIRVRNKLADQEVIKVEPQGKGKGNLITVNGHEPAFRSGEIKI